MRFTRRASAALLLLLAAGGCVSGAGAGRATGDGRVSAQAPGPAWKRIAVLPFAGPPQYRRVCEEALALRLGEQPAFAIVPPYAVWRAATRASAGAPGAATPAPGWAALGLAPPPRPLTRAELQELARGLEVDALVAGALVRSDTASTGVPAEGAGRIPPLGPLGLDVVVVDGASGEVVVRERWRESSGWAGLQRDATLHATACAGADLLALLGTPPGEAPRRPAPDPDCGAPVPPSPAP